MDLVIVGGGPAGLRAAEIASLHGLQVRLFDAKPSVGRKLLVAGKGGLNLTHSEPLDRFAKRYLGGHQNAVWTSLLSEFSNNDLRSWAKELGIETFIGTSGRVFPLGFKAAPLLRRWVERLRLLGVCFEMNKKLSEITRKDGRLILEFSSDGRLFPVTSDTVILALGGASWPETGSTGEWPILFEQLGIAVSPLVAANCGWEVCWNADIIGEIEGQPLKNITVSAGEKKIAGELLITRYGLEGGALYQLGNTLRTLIKPALTIDLKPSFSEEELADKIRFSSNNLTDSAICSWRLSKAAGFLLRYFAVEKSLTDPLSLAKEAKALTIPLIGPRPIAEAISSAGGVAFSELNEYLMIKRIPGLFVAGEMIDWEAPTGGYLLQGCFATGTRAANGVFHFLNNERPFSQI